MEVTLKRIVRDCLALRGESPDLLPVLEEDEKSAVLTIEDEISVRLPYEAVAATLLTPVGLLGDVAVPVSSLPSEADGPAYLKLFTPSLAVPFPAFDGTILTIGRAAYPVLLRRFAAPAT